MQKSYKNQYSYGSAIKNWYSTLQRNWSAFRLDVLCVLTRSDSYTYGPIRYETPAVTECMQMRGEISALSVHISESTR
jgi:hypothetical protein